MDHSRISPTTIVDANKMADEESGLLATALGVIGRSPLAVVPPDSKARALLNTEAILKNGGGKIDMFRIITTDYTDIYDFDIFVVKPPPDVRELNYRSPPLLVITDLCLRCGKALTYLGYYRYTYIFEGDDGVDTLPSACLLHTGSATIEEGINIGCHLCIYIKSCLDAKGVPLEQINASNIEMCWQRESGKMMLSRINFAMILRDRERSAQKYWNFLKLKPWHETEFGATRFGVTEKTPQPYTGAEQSREQAIQWLSRCQANADGIHSQCNQEMRDWLPSRLLDVQGTQDTASLKLVIPAENPDLFASDKRYITLSHCWGRWGAVNLPVLNTKNLHERTTKGLDLSLLPQTFKDALVIAQWFQGKSFNYLNDLLRQRPNVIPSPMAVDRLTLHCARQRHRLGKRVSHDAQCLQERPTEHFCRRRSRCSFWMFQIQTSVVRVSSSTRARGRESLRYRLVLAHIRLQSAL